MELEIQKQRNSLERKFEDPDIVVRDLMYALTTPRAPARILSGNMANRFFKILYWLPCKWRDSILFKGFLCRNIFVSKIIIFLIKMMLS